MKRMIALTGCALFLLALCANVTVAAESKIGYVELQKVLTLSKAGKAATAIVGEKFKEFQKKIESREEELKTLEEEFEKRKMVLTDEKKAEKEREYQQKVKELQRFAKDAEDEINQHQARKIQQMLGELEGVIEKVGEEEGYALIVERKESGILYADDRIDLTEKIIEAYDAEFEKAQAK